MNRNYKIQILTNRSNWIESGEILVFVQFFFGRHEDDYPCSIFDAIRVVRQRLSAAGLLVDHDMKWHEGWIIAIHSANWYEAQKVMQEVMRSHDFGSRLPIVKLQNLDWDYNPAQPEIFTRNADFVGNSGDIAEDMSDWTGFDVSFHDTSSYKGYWSVTLPTDDDRRRFADSCEEHENARKRISKAMVNGVLVLTREQYERAQQAIDAIRRKRVKEVDNFVVVDLSDTATRQIVAVLDAAGI